MVGIDLILKFGCPPSFRNDNCIKQTSMLNSKYFIKVSLKFARAKKIPPSNLLQKGSNNFIRIIGVRFLLVTLLCIYSVANQCNATPIKLLCINDDFKYKHPHFKTLDKSDFKKFIKSYKEALLFGNEEEKIEEVNELPFLPDQYVDFWFWTNEVLSKKQLDFNFSFDGTDKIEHIYSWVTKETSSPDGVTTVVHYIYHFILKSAAPASSKLKVVFPDGYIESYKP
jgi:hypothetical protein